MVKFGNEATVQSGLLRFILTVQIDLDKQGNLRHLVARRCKLQMLGERVSYSGSLQEFMISKASVPERVPHHTDNEIRDALLRQVAALSENPRKA